VTSINLERSWHFVHSEECWGGAASGICHAVNRPTDPGGATIHGVAKNYWPELWANGPPTVEDAKTLFYERFWLPCHCEALPWPLCLVVVDWAYLSGEDNPANALQTLAGLPKHDGDIGPGTVVAVRGWMARLASESVLRARRKEFRGNPNAKNNPGWFTRIDRVARAAGVLPPT